VDEFHVFSIEWSQDTIQWLMNDEVFHTITSENVAPYESPFNAPFFFIMNIAVGGNWPGYPDESTLFPQFMAVDYIRVYQ
jgi:beta-glucanase (GH16 family)